MMAKSINAAFAVTRRTISLKSPSVADGTENDEQRSWRRDVQEAPMSTPYFPSRHRHAASPSSPWAWSDFYVDVHGVADDCDQQSRGLVKSRTHDEREVDKSRMSTYRGDGELSNVYKVCVLDDGSFDEQTEAHTMRKDDAELQAYRKQSGVPPLLNARVQALFVEDVSLPVLQMLGTRYNVDPFFFEASANRMSSRYQEVPNNLEDRITVIFPFVCTIKYQRPSISSTASSESRSWGITESRLCAEGNKISDTQAPLILPGNKILFQDSLAFYMIRNMTGSTIISYHSSLQSQGSSAKRLKSLMQRTCDDVYWSRIFKRSKDPTFVLLGILWYAVYAWDETLDVLFGHVNTLEHDVFESNDMTLSQTFHRLQTRILSYEQFLKDFLRSVEFVRDAPNAAMNSPSISKDEREDSAKLLHTEADTLRSEIKRLDYKRQMLSARLDNISNLTFLNVKSGYNKSKQRLAASIVKEFSILKQRIYLSMIFIPATYLVNVYKMETMGTRICYIVAIVGLTLFTSWIVIAAQKGISHYPRDSVLPDRPWPCARGAISNRFKWSSSDESDRPDVRARYLSEQHA